MILFSLLNWKCRNMSREVDPDLSKKVKTNTNEQKLSNKLVNFLKNIFN